MTPVPGDTMQQIAALTPAIIAAVNDLFREHITVDTVKFIFIAMPASNFQQAAFGSNFPLDRMVLLRKLMNASLDAVEKQMVASAMPAGHA